MTSTRPQNVRPPLRVLAVAGDLLFESQVVGAARAAGATARGVRSLDDARRAIADADVLVVDMTLPLDVAVEVIELAARAAHHPQALAVFPHVQTELKQAAQRAGAARTMPRSAAHERLGAILIEIASARRSIKPETA